MTQAEILRRVKADLKRLNEINKKIKESPSPQLEAKRDRLIKDINRIAKMYGKPH